MPSGNSKAASSGIASIKSLCSARMGLISLTLANTRSSRITRLFSFSRSSRAGFLEALLRFFQTGKRRKSLVVRFHLAADIHDAARQTALDFQLEFAFRPETDGSRSTEPDSE